MFSFSPLLLPATPEADAGTVNITALRATSASAAKTRQNALCRTKGFAKTNAGSVWPYGFHSHKEMVVICLRSRRHSGKGRN